MIWRSQLDDLYVLTKLIRYSVKNIISIMETGREEIFRSNNSIHRASIQVAIYGQFERSIFLYRDHIAISI